MRLKQVIYAAIGMFRILTKKVAPTVYMEEIEDHFSELFDIKEEDHRVIHELMSEKVHIDLHIIAPDENRPFYVVFTTGMSDLPMTMGEDVPWDLRKTHERAELFCLLPPDWKTEFSKGSQKDYDRFWWIFAAIKQAARYPHLSGTWIGSNHTLQYSEDNTPFHESTKLCSAIFLHLDEKDFGGKYGDRMNYMRTKDGSYINLLCFIPLYAEEIDFKLDNGSDELFMRMFGSTVTDMLQLVLDPQRKNYCTAETA